MTCEWIMQYRIYPQSYACAYYCSAVGHWTQLFRLDKRGLAQFSWQLRGIWHWQLIFIQAINNCTLAFKQGTPPCQHCNDQTAQHNRTVAQNLRVIMAYKIITCLLQSQILLCSSDLVFLGDFCYKIAIKIDCSRIVLQTYFLCLVKCGLIWLEMWM